MGSNECKMSKSLLTTAYISKYFQADTGKKIAETQAHPLVRTHVSALGKQVQSGCGQHSQRQCLGHTNTIHPG